MSANSTDGSKLRGGRWWRLAAVAALAVSIAAVVALPWWLSTTGGRDWLLVRANRVLSPSRLEFKTVRVSWFRATSFTNVVLHDAQGDEVLVAPTAAWDRNLFQIIFQRPRLGTLRLDRAGVDAESLPSGAIDLYETLKPVLVRDPKTSIRIELPNGRVRLRAERLSAPIVAEQAAIRIEVSPFPGPIDWKIALANRRDGKLESVATQGRFYRDGKTPAGIPELDAIVAGERWPFDVGNANLRAGGRLDGKVRLRHDSEGWECAGDAVLLGVETSGGWLAGDAPRLGDVKGVWALRASGSTFTVQRLDVDSKLATLHADSASRLNGRIDLASLAGQLPRTLRLRKDVTIEQGTAELKIETETVRGETVVDVSARVGDVRARDRERTFTLRDPATLAARLRPGPDTILLETFRAETAFLHVDAVGELAKGVQLKGTVDVAGFQKQFRDLLDLADLELAGKGELTGSFQAIRDRYHGQLAIDLKKVRIAGPGAVGIERDEAKLALWFNQNGKTDGSGLSSTGNAWKVMLTLGRVTEPVEGLSGDHGGGQGNSQ